MKPTTSSSINYAPSAVPQDAKQLSVFLADEFDKLSAVIQSLALGHLEITTVAPPKPRSGDLRLADGTLWNPGSGAGVYAYYGSAWHFLG